MTSPDRNEAESNTFQVLREVRSGLLLGTPLRLGQSISESDLSTSLSSQVEASYNSAEEERHLHNLIQRAINWLLLQTPRMYAQTGVTMSIYWAIRSLTTFYSEQIALATQSGLPTIQEPEEDEWPDEPDDDEDEDLFNLPEWLQYILVVDDLYERGLQEISGRRMPRGRTRRAQWFPPAHLFIETIPERELDEPPDSELSGSEDAGLIVELSVPNIVNIKIEDTISS